MFDASMFTSDPSAALDQNNGRRPSDEKAVFQFQTRFIQQTFTDPLLKSNGSFFGEDEEEEGFFSSSSNTEMINSMMSYYLAQEFARKDMFKMNEMLMKQINTLKSAPTGM
jgi:Rod binding domain-containing protein